MMSMEEVVDFILEHEGLCPDCRQCYFNRCIDCTYYTQSKKGDKCNLRIEEKIKCESCTLSHYAPITFTDMEEWRTKIAEYIKIEKMKEILK